MSADIHPTAIIEDGAELAEGVQVGPYCIVGPQARIGARTRLLSHVSITGRTTIGQDCIIHPFAALGSPAQDFKHKDSDEVALEIGDRNVMREHVTMHMGTKASRSVTRVGSGGFFMAGAHVAHDCVVGDNVVFANNVALGGGADVDDFVIMGGLSALHQQCRIGRYAFVGGGAPVVGDVIPFGMVSNDGYLGGLNLVGLKRRGFSRDAIHDLRAAYRLLFAEEGAFTERVEDTARIFEGREEVQTIIDFLRAPARRPLCFPAPR
jgi:UDP-N-acetylglucosamine acyltransferase